MNYSTAVMLINENIRAISAIYEVDGVNTKAPRTTFKTLDNDIQIGDYVIVPSGTRHNRTVVKVVDVDVEVDFESITPIEWVIDRIDTAAHDKIIAEESKWITTLKASQRLAKREEIKNKVLGFHKEELSKMAIANMEQPAAALSHQPE